jgi:CubicO group peptidase (beta-lactamase class C family)
MSFDGRWHGPARVLDAPGMVEVVIDGSAVAVTLHQIGLATQPLSDVEIDGNRLRGQLGHIGAVEITADGPGLTLHWARGGETLDVALTALDGDDVGDGPYPYVDDVVVSHRGEIIRDDYFNGITADDIHTQQSCTKSITSLVFGTAVDRGEIELDAPVWTYFEKSRPESRWVRERYDATVHHLLCMSVGLEWNEVVHYTDPRNDNTRMNASGDWVGYVLDRPLQEGFPRGARFEYQSGLSILVGAVLQAATGRPVDELARERLFGPLGIDHFRWTKDGDGNPHTGGGLILRPRDMVKLGRVILDGGGAVLSKEWIDVSTRHHTTHDESGTKYAYKWFLGDLPVGDRTWSTIAAGGYGGQSLMVFPELDLVVQSNAHDWFGDGALGKLAVEAVETVLGT